MKLSRLFVWTFIFTLNLCCSFQAEGKTEFDKFKERVHLLISKLQFYENDNDIKEKLREVDYSVYFNKINQPIIYDIDIFDTLFSALGEVASVELEKYNIIIDSAPLQFKWLKITEDIERMSEGLSSIYCNRFSDKDELNHIIQSAGLFKEIDNKLGFVNEEYKNYLISKRSARQVVQFFKNRKN